MYATVAVHIHRDDNIALLQTVYSHRCDVTFFKKRLRLHENK
jgi:hypothetical protein